MVAEKFIKDGDVGSPQRSESTFQGPPYHLSALSYTPNENPLPPYEDYCHVLPNLAKMVPVVRGSKKKGKKHILNDLAEADEDEMESTLWFGVPCFPNTPRKPW